MGPPGPPGPSDAFSTFADVDDGDVEAQMVTLVAVRVGMLTEQ